jgi:hypothetical protein
MKYLIHTLSQRHGPGEHLIDAECILTADCDWDSRRLYVIGHEHGATCAVFASDESDAFDAACDADLLKCFEIDDADATEETVRLGNYGQPVDLTYAWISVADDLQPAETALALAYACGSQYGGVASLDDVKPRFKVRK